MENLSEKRKLAAKTSKLKLTSNFWRTFLTVLAALLTFAGPTYLVLIFSKALDINYAYSMVSGFILFVAGLALILFLIKNKIIS